MRGGGDPGFKTSGGTGGLVSLIARGRMSVPSRLVCGCGVESVDLGGAGCVGSSDHTINGYQNLELSCLPSCDTTNPRRITRSRLAIKASLFAL